MPLYRVTLPMQEQLLIPTLDFKNGRKKKKCGDFSDKILNRFYFMLTLHGLIPIEEKLL